MAMDRGRLAQARKALREIAEGRASLVQEDAVALVTAAYDLLTAAESQAETLAGECGRLRGQVGRLRDRLWAHDSAAVLEAMGEQ